MFNKPPLLKIVSNCFLLKPSLSQVCGLFSQYYQIFLKKSKNWIKKPEKGINNCTTKACCQTHCWQPHLFPLSSLWHNQVRPGYPVSCIQTSQMKRKALKVLFSHLLWPIFYVLFWNTWWILIGGWIHAQCM